MSMSIDGLSSGDETSGRQSRNLVPALSSAQTSMLMDVQDSNELDEGSNEDVVNEAGNLFFLT